MSKVSGVLLLHHLCSCRSLHPGGDGPGQVHGIWQPSRMSWTVCVWMNSFPFIYGFFINLMSTLWTYGLYFCGNIEINHFYAVLTCIKLICGGTCIKKCTMHTSSSLNFSFPLLVIIVTYILVLIAIIKTCSAEGGRKHFLACTWQLTPYFMEPSSCILERETRNQ